MRLYYGGDIVLKDKAIGLSKKISYGKVIDQITRSNAYYIGKRLEKHNLNKSEYKYLIQIYNKEGICQEDLATILKCEKHEVAKGIKALVDKGYLYKEKDKDDKRRYKIYLEEKAKIARDSIVDVLEESSDIMTKGFTETEKDTLIELLLRMSENMHEAAVDMKKGRMI
jgi:DNA-binding MarR family transcriptional regulator